ncbi:YggT family protein [Corynebacterium hesseae]|nr:MULTISPECIES: YggT family protein [Corynebacterium]
MFAEREPEGRGIPLAGVVRIGSGTVNALGSILLVAVSLYSWILLARIVIEMIQSFSRQFNPPRWFMMVAEVLFVVTDPPVKALRKVIPPLQLGGVALDVSIIVLFLLLSILSQLISWLFFGPSGLAV